MACSGGPMNTRLYLCNSSGSLGFSEACPQPAHTACLKKDRQMKVSAWLIVSHNALLKNSQGHSVNNSR